MANDNSFWMDTMLPSIGAGAVSTLSNLAIMHAQNKFNAEQAQIARNWNLDVDNSKYQRAVADMQKAGVNPALMMSKGPISTQAATNISAQGATPAYMNMSAVASLAQTISQAKLNDAQRRNLDASTNKMNAEAERAWQEAFGFNIDNQYRDEFNQLNLEGKRLSNSMTEEQIKDVKQTIEVKKADVAKKLAEAKTEEEKVKLMLTQEALNNAEAYKIYALTPFHQKLMAAQTEEAKASAGLKMVQAAYQRGLINAGMIEATVRQTNANASKAEIDAIVQETLHSLNFEQKQVNNIESQTVGNYTRAVANVVNSLANVIDSVVPF